MQGASGDRDPQQGLHPASQAAEAATRARDLIERAREASSWSDLATTPAATDPIASALGEAPDMLGAQSASAPLKLSEPDWLIGAREALAAEAKEVVMDQTRQTAPAQPMPTEQPTPSAVGESLFAASSSAPSAAYQSQPLGTDRLPWLEAGEDDDAYGLDSRRVMLAVGAGLALLGSVVGGVWFFTHRSAQEAPPADGSYVPAPAGSFKEAPSDPGGKQYAGTGDTSYAASQGEQRLAQLGGDSAVPQAGASFAGGAPVVAAEAAASAAAAPKAAAVAPVEEAGPAGGVVQIAAYTSEAAAQAGWNRLVTAHEMLKGMNHRIVSAKIDLGTVYRLQLVTSAGGGAALCERLKAEALPCQVKH